MKWPDDYDAETVAMSGGTGTPAMEWARRNSLATKVAEPESQNAALLHLAREMLATLTLDRNRKYIHPELLALIPNWEKQLGDAIGTPPLVKSQPKRK